MFGVYKGDPVLLRADHRETDIEIWLRLLPLFLDNNPSAAAEYYETLQHKNLRVEVFDGTAPYPVPHAAFMDRFNRFKRWVSLRRAVRRVARTARWTRLRQEIVAAAWAPERLEKGLITDDTV
jgi:hypothetical protein